MVLGKQSNSLGVVDIRVVLSSWNGDILPWESPMQLQLGDERKGITLLVISFPYLSTLHPHSYLQHPTSYRMCTYTDRQTLKASSVFFFFAFTFIVLCYISFLLLGIHDVFSRFSSTMFLKVGLAVNKKIFKNSRGQHISCSLKYLTYSINLIYFECAVNN